MATVNMAAVRVSVASDNSGRMKAAATQRANEVFEDAVIGMQIEFEEHDVTREIAGGVSASNISRTLGGGRETKNLYSFIGFSAQDPVSPLEPIRDALDPSSTVGKIIGPQIRFSGKAVKDGNAQFKFEVAAPNKTAVFKATPMPWAPGLSWAQKIETSIPGFASFLAKRMGVPSQSGGGIQAKDKNGNPIIIRNESYEAPDGGYLTTIFENFLAKVKQYGKGGLRRRFK